MAAPGRPVRAAALAPAGLMGSSGAGLCKVACAGAALPTE